MRATSIAVLLLALTVSACGVKAKLGPPAEDNHARAFASGEQS